MKEDRRLRDSCLFQLVRSSSEHDRRDVETEDVVCLVEQGLGFRILFVNILGHARKLRALAWEDVCFQNSCLLMIISRAK